MKELFSNFFITQGYEQGATLQLTKLNVGLFQSIKILAISLKISNFLLPLSQLAFHNHNGLERKVVPHKVCTSARSSQINF